MDFLIIIAESESREIMAPGTPGFDEYMGDWTAYNNRLVEGGHWIDGGRLLPSSTARTIRRSSGADTIVDGPFAETKEMFGGYYLVSAADLDEALALAADMPLTDAAIEVRAVAFRPAM